MSTTTIDTVDTLVLSGGGVRGIAFLGAIQFLLDRGVLKNINSFIGTSVGCIIAYLLIIGYTPIELVVFFYEKEGRIFMERFGQLNTSQLLQGKGVIDHQVLVDVLELLTFRKLSSLPTLSSLYSDFQKSLTCVTFNQTTNETEYLSWESHPDMPCIDALRMSSTIPILFDPVVFKNQVYFDGGLTQNLPLRCVPQSAHVIALRLLCSYDFTIPASNIFMTLHNVLMTMVHHQENQEIEYCLNRRQNDEREKLHIITIHIDRIFTMELGMNSQQKFDLFSCGYQTTRDVFEKLFL